MMWYNILCGQRKEQQQIPCVPELTDSLVCHLQRGQNVHWAATSFILYYKPIPVAGALWHTNQLHFSSLSYVQLHCPWKYVYLLSAWASRLTLKLLFYGLCYLLLQQSCFISKVFVKWMRKDEYMIQDIWATILWVIYFDDRCSGDWFISGEKSSLSSGNFRLICKPCWKHLYRKHGRVWFYVLCYTLKGTTLSLDFNTADDRECPHWCRCLISTRITIYTHLY